MPGPVEGHAHLMAGTIWTYPYNGYHDRIDPEGLLVEGSPDLDAVIASRWSSAAKLGEGEPLVARGFDPIFLPGRKLQRHHLDRVSATRP